MVPAGSDQVSRARPYSGARPGRLRDFVYGTVTLCGPAFQPVRLPRSFVTSRPAGRRIKTSPTTPARQRLPPITSHRFGLFPFRSPLLRESLDYFLFLRLLRCFSSPGWPLQPMNSAAANSGIPGSKPVCRLPRAYRRLPRPSSPSGAKTSPMRP